MINDLDEVLRELLKRELPIKNGEVEIAFEQPKREWSARLNRPTLNLFLYDLHENKKLRQTQPMWTNEPNGNGTVTQRRRPVRIDLRYMITAWATESEDEHRLLTAVLLALFRHPNLPEDLLPESLQAQPTPISLTVAQEENLGNPSDFWSAMDNELRPAVPCVLTMALDPYRPIAVPLVRTRELRIGQARKLPVQQLAEVGEPDRFWTIGGTVQSKQPPEKVQLVLLEQGLTVPLQPEGRFAIGNLRAGAYTLEVSVEGRKPRQYEITVPAADYDLAID